MNPKAAEAAEKKKAKAAAAAEKKAGGESAPPPKGYVPRLKKIYRETVAPELFKEFSYDSTMQVPRFVKVIVSMGVGEAKENKKILDAAVEDLGADHRPARGEDEGAQVHRDLQDPRRARRSARGSPFAAP